MIDEILNKEMTKKQFLTSVGLGIFALIVMPSLLNWIFKEKESDLKIKDDGIYHKGVRIMEINNG